MVAAAAKEGGTFYHVTQKLSHNQDFQGTQPVGHKAPNYLVYISSLSPALQSLYLSLFTRFSPSIFQQQLLLYDL